jgi:hypothetical protein
VREPWLSPPFVVITWPAVTYRMRCATLHGGRQFANSANKRGQAARTSESTRAVGHRATDCRKKCRNSVIVPLRMVRSRKGARAMTAGMSTCGPLRRCADGRATGSTGRQRWRAALPVRILCRHHSGRANVCPAVLTVADAAGAQDNRERERSHPDDDPPSYGING